MTDDDDLRCPLCGSLATGTSFSGWMFFCEPCNRKWGHPQQMTEREAAIELHEATQLEQK